VLPAESGTQSRLRKACPLLESCRRPVPNPRTLCCDTPPTQQTRRSPPFQLFLQAIYELLRLPLIPAQHPGQHARAVGDQRRCRRRIVGHRLPGLALWDAQLEADCLQQNR
jgi:hypothetical protein